MGVKLNNQKKHLYGAKKRIGERIAKRCLIPDETYQLIDWDRVRDDGNEYLDAKIGIMELIYGTTVYEGGLRHFKFDENRKEWYTKRFTPEWVSRGIPDSLYLDLNETQLNFELWLDNNDWIEFIDANPNLFHAMMNTTNGRNNLTFR